MLLCTVLVLINSTANAFKLWMDEEEVILLTENPKEERTEDSESKGEGYEDSIIPNFASRPQALLDNSTYNNSCIGAFSMKYPEVITPPPQV